MFSAPHTATAKKTARVYTLSYDGGTAAFTAGKTLTGATSHATATILTLTGNATAGTLYIHSITGTFQNNEPLSDNGTVPGAALADGVAVAAFDSYGQDYNTTVDTTIACRFFRKAVLSVSGDSQTGVYSDSQVYAMLPPTTTVIEDDQITTTVSGSSGTYRVTQLTPAYSLAILHHYTATLGRVL